jgi:hypothetical protein
MTNDFCAPVNFGALTPNLLAQPRKSAADNSTRKWSSFQVAEHFLAAQFGHGVFAMQAFQHNADLVLGREMATRLPPDVLHHPLGRGLSRRFFQGVLRLHLRSFVTTTKPQHSLNHNLNSVPLALTG